MNGKLRMAGYFLGKCNIFPDYLQISKKMGAMAADFFLKKIINAVSEGEVVEESNKTQSGG